MKALLEVFDYSEDSQALYSPGCDDDICGTLQIHVDSSNIARHYVAWRKTKEPPIVEESIGLFGDMSNSEVADLATKNGYFFQDVWILQPSVKGDLVDWSVWANGSGLQIVEQPANHSQDTLFLGLSYLVSHIVRPEHRVIRNGINQHHILFEFHQQLMSGVMCTVFAVLDPGEYLGIAGMHSLLWTGGSVRILPSSITDSVPEK